MCVLITSNSKLLIVQIETYAQMNLKLLLSRNELLNILPCCIS